MACLQSTIHHDSPVRAFDGISMNGNACRRTKGKRPFRKSIGDNRTQRTQHLNGGQNKPWTATVNLNVRRWILKQRDRGFGAQIHAFSQRPVDSKRLTLKLQNQPAMTTILI